MRLEATVISILNIRLNRILLCAFVLFLLTKPESWSQDYKITFIKDTPLSEALLQASRTFNFKVAFDSRQLSTTYVSDEYIGNHREELINNLLKNTRFTYIYKHGCFLIVDNNEGPEDNLPKECHITGTILDFKTGEQLPFASIAIPSQNITTLTSTNGTFSIKNILSNPVKIVISYIGYFTIDTLISWTDQNINHTFKLKHKINLIDTVNVKSIKIEIVDYRNDVDFATTVNAMRLIDMPTIAETDIFRTLQLLPGISYSESSSELSIRGGSSDQNLVLFDGQTLYNLSHYYGVFSSVNPNIVKDVQVYKGGFDSRYGERISGIVDITGKSGNQQKPVLSAYINLLDVNLAAEVPISKKLTFIAAGRRSYSDIYKTSFADNLFNKNEPSIKSEPNDTIIISEPSFYFYDLNGKLNYRINNKENISISLYTGKDHYQNSYSYNSQAMYVWNNDSNSWKNFGASINWQKQWNNSLFSNLSASVSGYENNSENTTNINPKTIEGKPDKYLPDSQNYFYSQSRNRLKDVSVSIRNTYTINSYNQLSFGAMARHNEIYYYKVADKTYIYDNFTQSAIISSIYLQDRVSLFENLTLKPGFRVSYYEGTNKLYFEPRFAAKYNITNQLSFRFATGLYNQFISQVISQQETGYNKNFWVLANDSVIPVLQANHFILGSAWEKNKILIDVEGYYKQYSGLQEYIFISQFLKNSNFNNYFPGVPISENPPPNSVTSSPKPSYFISGKGKSYGIDFFIRYKSFYFTSWLSYSLSKHVQKFDSINNGNQIPALTDKTHQVSLSNLFTYKNWNIGLVFLYSTGRPYIDKAENEENMPLTRHYSRMPDYFRCDLSTNYNFGYKNTRFKVGASVINLFNTQNYYDVNTHTYDFENTTFSETNLVQSQKLSLNLFLHISINQE